MSAWRTIPAVRVGKGEPSLLTKRGKKYYHLCVRCGIEHAVKAERQTKMCTDCRSVERMSA